MKLVKQFKSIENESCSNCDVAMDHPNVVNKSNILRLRKSSTRMLIGHYRPNKVWLKNFMGYFTQTFNIKVTEIPIFQNKSHKTIKIIPDIMLNKNNR